MREEIHVLVDLVDLVDLYRSLPEKNDYRDLDLAPPFPENAHTVHVDLHVDLEDLHV